MKLVTEIYATLQSFPKHELYGLSNQIRRASVSVPANIAEGKMRSSDADFNRFVYIALGSIAEVDTLLEIAKNLEYISIETFTKLEKDIVVIRKMLHALKNSLKSS